MTITPETRAELVDCFFRTTKFNEEDGANGTLETSFKYKSCDATFYDSWSWLTASTYLRNFSNVPYYQYKFFLEKPNAVKYSDPLP